jgi:predicted transcriptional regulator
MKPANIELTGAEWAVIKAVWAGEPCTAPAIREQLLAETRWTYSTTRTVMDRMVVKGLLAAEKQGKMTRYRSLVTRVQAQRGEVLYALKHAFNGALTPMVQCLIETGPLNEAELNELETLIKCRKKAAKKTT